MQYGLRTYIKYLCDRLTVVESQKGINVVQQGSVENQKGAVAIDFVQW